MTFVPTKLLFLPALLMLIIFTGCEKPGVSSAERIVLGQHEHAKGFGNYIVHVNALTTNQLPADVARTYKIQRSKSQIMLNVVITNNVDGVEKPVTGIVTALTRNLAGQVKNLKIREIREQQAIYYIGTASVTNAETLIFDIDVTPVNETTPFLLKYKQQFFTE